MSATPGDSKRQVNELMRLRNRGDREQIPFICECADECCYQAVWLTGPEYDQARADPAWLALVAGHVPGSQALAAR
jgi:hypothetical protein